MRGQCVTFSKRIGVGFQLEHIETRPAAPQSIPPIELQFVARQHQISGTAINGLQMGLV